MDINWDEAPEGATHYCIGGDSGTAWRDLSGVGAKYWYEGKWHDHSGVNSEFCLKHAVFEARPTTLCWNGEGLPPVGTVCEVKSTARGKERDWFKAQVKYLSPFTVVLDDFPIGELEGEFVVHPNTVQFRPIKTKEQLAAEEREKVINQMEWDGGADLSSAERILLEKLYDAGYRKQENLDE